MKHRQYKAILFDLDGTLTDPKSGITRSVAYALRKSGIIVDDIETLMKFIGPPLPDSFMKYYGLDEERAKKAVAYFRERFSEKGLYENRMYKGVDRLLEALSAAKKSIVLATSKATVFAERILDHFAIRKYFTHVVGSNYDLTRTKKSEVIEHAISLLPDFSHASMVMVGDHADDIMGAHKNRIDSIAVFYGYGTIPGLKRAKPTYVVRSIDELHVLLTA
jgi:phosphoglycolate phosphatase